MPRIPREAHATIRHRVDVEGQKVAEVAAAYGCTPANIYAILARLRRQGGQDAGDAVPSASVPEPGPAAVPAEAASADLFGGLAEARPDPASPAAPAPIASAPPVTASDSPSPPTITAPALPPAQPASSAPIRSGRAEAAPRSSPSSPTPRAGKAGYALLMRTSDGEEAVHPFRSLDELLSAAKPILRTAARSPEPIWFSIQQVDLEALEDDF
jgi:hypothetical protein